ncbi:hypothetical protein Btru_017251 [Bulinus truncatus]|nr:hypothetical protein Btru_017251 [Bulinus truncatus]
MKRVPPNILSLTQSDHLPTAPSLRIQVLKNSKGYVELNLNDRDLRIVPPETFHMISVQVLRLANNHIDHLPLMIAYLRDLKVLDLQHNLLVSLPETLTNCRHLAEMKLTANRLTDLPKSIGGLESLRVLELGENQFEQLPQEIGLMSSLRILDLHSNKLWHLPVTLQGCKQLVKLDLSDNMFDHVPLAVTKLTSLKALSLAKNRLAALPVDFDCLKSLRELNLSNNKFASISSMLLALTHLRYLTLASNGLKFLPPHMSTLKNLRVLHLQDNELRHVPSSFKYLNYYNVSKNHLTTFSVENIRNLVSLAASHNELEIPPRGLYKLKHLKFLYLDNNNLMELEDDIGKLRQLRVLDLSDNQLTVLPQPLYRLPLLHTFNVKGNYKLTRTGNFVIHTDKAGRLQGDQSQDPTQNLESFADRTLKKTMTLSGQIQFDKESHELKKMQGKGKNNGLQSLQKMNGYGPDMLQTQQAYFDNQSRNETIKSLKKKTKNSPDSPDGDIKSTKFQSLRSLREILFGKSKNTKNSSSENQTATMRSSHSINFPIQYSREEVWAGERSNRNKQSTNRDMFPGRSRLRSKLNEATFEENAQVPESYPSDDYVTRSYQRNGRVRNKVSINRANSYRNVFYQSQKDMHYDHRDFDESLDSDSDEEGQYRAQDRFHFGDVKKQRSLDDVEDNPNGELHRQRTYQLHTRQDEEDFDQDIVPQYQQRRQQWQKYSPDKHSQKNYWHGEENFHRKHKRGHETSNKETRNNYGNVYYDKTNSRHWMTYPNTTDSDSDGSSYNEDDGRYWTFSDQNGEQQDKQYGESPQAFRVKGRYFQDKQRHKFDHILSTQKDEERSSQEAGPAMYYDENFMMRKKKTRGLARNRSLDSLLNQFSEKQLGNSPYPEKQLGNSPYPERKQQNNDGSRLSFENHPDLLNRNGTDYSLLGVCSQVEDLLNKNFMQPARGRKSNGLKNIKNYPDRQRMYSNEYETMGRTKKKFTGEETKDDPDIEYHQPQIFTVTSLGGQFTSSGHPTVTVTMPAHAVSQNVRITVQMLSISQNLLNSIQQLNRFVNNILAMGPIVYLHTDRDVSFNTQATLTLPAPPAVRGGHLAVLTVRGDNSCLPCSHSYRSSKLSATLNIWHLSAKVALVTRAKCKYKACKSMEQLLLCLGVGR